MNTSGSRKQSGKNSWNYHGKTSLRHIPHPPLGRGTWYHGTYHQQTLRAREAWIYNIRRHLRCRLGQSIPWDNRAHNRLCPRCKMDLWINLGGSSSVHRVLSWEAEGDCFKLCCTQKRSEVCDVLVHLHHCCSSPEQGTDPPKNALIGPCDELVAHAGVYPAFVTCSWDGVQFPPRDPTRKPADKKTTWQIDTEFVPTLC